MAQVPGSAARSIPTIAVFHHGKEINRASGVRPAAAIEAMVAQLV